MKKYIVLLPLFICLTTFFCSCVISDTAISESEKMTRRYQYVVVKGDTMAEFPLLTVKEEKIYAILDSIIEFNSRCIYTVMGEKIWFQISPSNYSRKDTLIICLGAHQYDETTAERMEGTFGVFYYKDFLFTVLNDDGLLNDFFEQTDTKKHVITSYYTNTVIYAIQPCEECYLYTQSVEIAYYYIDNQFKWFYKRKNCTDYYPIYHTIQEGDKLEIVAIKYTVTPNQIMRLNNLTEPVLPDSGKIKIQ